MNRLRLSCKTNSVVPGDSVPKFICSSVSPCPQEAILDENTHILRLHQAFVENRQGQFVGRKALVKQWVNKLASTHSGLLGLVGKPGSGKSSLMVCVCVCVCVYSSLSLFLSICLSLSLSLFLCLCLSLFLCLSLALSGSLSYSLPTLSLIQPSDAQTLLQNFQSNQL